MIDRLRGMIGMPYLHSEGWQRGKGGGTGEDVEGSREGETEDLVIH